MPSKEALKLDANIKTFMANIEKRKKKLKDFNIVVPTELPFVTVANLQEAINSYILNLKTASYTLVLRTIELTVNYYFDLFFPTKQKNNFKDKLKELNKKIQVSKTLLNFYGGQYEERNVIMHSLYEPTELELLSAFETTIKYVLALKKEADKIKMNKK